MAPPPPPPATDDDDDDDDDGGAAVLVGVTSAVRASSSAAGAADDVDDGSAASDDAPAAAAAAAATPAPPADAIDARGLAAPSMFRWAISIVCLLDRNFISLPLLYVVEGDRASCTVVGARVFLGGDYCGELVWRAGRRKYAKISCPQKHSFTLFQNSLR